MNKRGFTLIEIIAIIILLSVIALITYPVINNLITDSKEKLYEKQINELERLSNTWVTKNINKLKTKDGYVYDLSFEELNEQGFTSDKQIKNPKTGKNLTGCMKVTYNSSKNGYDVAYDESCTTSGEAKEETDLACFKFEPYNDSGVEIKNGSLVGFKCYEGNSEGLPVVKDVVIPNSVVIIRNYAFMSKGLTSVDFSRATNLKTIENAVFGGNQLTSVTIPSSVTTIGSYAFLQNKLISVEIPNSVTTIESNAFANNQLVNVTIPNSVTTIGNDAFSTNYSLKSITIDKEEGSIEGSPWGALSSTTITWKR